MSKLQVVQVSSLGGGVNSNLSSIDLPSNKSPSTARNIRLQGNSKKPRKGYLETFDLLTGGTQMQGMTEYIRDVKADDRLVSAYNKKLYDIDPSTESSWTEMFQPSQYAKGTGTPSDILTVWDDITNGTLILSNGVRADGMDFSAVTSIKDVTDIISAALTLDAGTRYEVIWDGTAFLVTFPGNAVVSGSIMYTKTGLTLGTEYEFYVVARNAIGDSGSTNFVKLRTATHASAPIAPTALSFDTVTQTTLSLNWTDNSTDETAFAIFQDGIEIDTVGAGVTTYPVTGLSSQTHYEFNVVARNASGDSGSTNTVGVLTSNDATPPIAPTALLHSLLDDDSVRLTWEDNSSTETDFQIWRNGVAIDTVTAGVTTYNASLSEDTIYEFYVVARNGAAASGSTNTIKIQTAENATAGKPTPPDDLTFDNIATTTVDLTWDDNSTNETSFQLFTDDASPVNAGVNIGGDGFMGFANTITVVNATDNDNRTFFTSFGDWLFSFNGLDRPKWITGDVVLSGFTKPDSFTNTSEFTPAFGDVFQKAMWVSGVPKSPNTVFISKPALTDQPIDIIDFSGAISTGAADEILLKDRCTGVVAMSSLILLFTATNCYYVDGFVDNGTTVLPNISPISGASGSVGNGAVTTVENDVYYLTPQKEIKSIKRGFAESLSANIFTISDDIKDFLKEELDDEQSKAFGYYDEVNKLYKLCVKSVGSTFNDIRIVADMRKIDENGVPEWMIDDSMRFSCGATFNNVVYTGSELDGTTYIDESGYTDNDAEKITTIWDTKDFVANNPTTLKRYRDLTVFGRMNRFTTTYVEIYVDGVLVTSQSISDDALPTESLDCKTIGDFIIGTEPVGGCDEGAGNEDLIEFTQRIPFRYQGKKISVKFISNGALNNYDMNYLEYSFIALSKLFNPIGEKL